MSSTPAFNSEDVLQMKSFISEADLEERRRRRQEEWEKVRKPDEPLEAPEEEYDPRSLYERLEEQKQRKQAEYEEAHKLKNMIRGLDDDEVTFLEMVDKQKAAAESAVIKEERQVLDEFKKAVTDLSEKELEAKRQEVKKLVQAGSGSNSTTPPKKGQAALLSSAVKRKSTSTKDADTSAKKEKAGGDTAKDKPEVKNGQTASPDSEEHKGAFTVLGVLPGIGEYTDSSDSEASGNSGDEFQCEEGFDLISPGVNFFVRAVRYQQDLQKIQLKEANSSKIVAQS